MREVKKRQDRLADSPIPFTEWVRRGAREEDWKEFLKDMEAKIPRGKCLGIATCEGYHWY